MTDNKFTDWFEYPGILMHAFGFEINSLPQPSWRMNDLTILSATNSDRDFL
jgi:hypothetical protein